VRILLVMMRGGIAEAIAGGIGIVLILGLTGCGATTGKGTNQAEQPFTEAKTINNDPTIIPNDSRPHVVTNLSQISSQSASSSVNAQNLMSGAAILHKDSTSPTDEQDVADRNLDRVFLSKQRSMVHGGETKAAGDRTLLNAKARQFPEFSYALLNQTLVAAQDLEAKKLDQKKLPDEIKPIILMATMTPDGRLTDIGVMQHSGVGSVDRILIDACKQGLWSRNPPKAALADDGMFKMRIEAVVKNYSYNLDGNYSYVTHVGLALM
jgi:hypothetical protein